MPSHHSDQPFASVIIPVYQHSDPLILCLAELTKQSYPDTCFEVIVIDNNPDPQLEFIKKMFPDILLLHETNPSSYAARNLGVTHAKGEILAFIDADCVPGIGWLEHGVKALSLHHNQCIVGGKVAFYFDNLEKITPVEYFDSLSFFNMKNNIRTHQFSGTGNLFVASTLFHEIGQFDSDFQSAGDREWGYRAAQKNVKFIYEEKAEVSHPARKTLKEIIRKAKRIAGGIHQFNKKTGQSSSFLEWLPPMKRMHAILFSYHDLSKAARIQVLLITMLVKYIMLLERLKIQLGAKTSRS